MRRLRALDGYVLPLSVDVEPERIPEQRLKRYSTAPTRWLNIRDTKKTYKAREKWLKKRNKKSAELEGELAEVNREVDSLTQRAQRLEEEPVDASEKTAMEDSLASALSKRNSLIEQILGAGEKQLKKSDKKETKLANRILWVVITNIQKDANEDTDNWVDVESDSTA